MSVRRPLLDAGEAGMRTAARDEVASSVPQPTCRRRLLLAGGALAALSLAGCGFRLRGPQAQTGSIVRRWRHERRIQPGPGRVAVIRGGLGRPRLRDQHVAARRAFRARRQNG